MPQPNQIGFLDIIKAHHKMSLKATPTNNLFEMETFDVVYANHAMFHFQQYVLSYCSHSNQILKSEEKIMSHLFLGPNNVTPLIIRNNV